MVPIGPLKIFLRRFRIYMTVKNRNKYENEKKVNFETLARTSKLGLTLKIRWHMNNHKFVYFFRTHPRSGGRDSRRK